MNFLDRRRKKHHQRFFKPGYSHPTFFLHPTAKRKQPNKGPPSKWLRNLCGKWGEALLVVAAAQANADIKNSVTNTTSSKRCGDIHWWHKFLSQAEKTGDTFLQSVSTKDRLGKGDYIRCFLAIYRANGFSTKGQGKIGTATIRRALTNITSHFENEGHPNPVRNGGGKLIPNIDQLLKTYKLDDPAPKRQPPLPLTFFKQFLEMKETPTCEAISQLFCGGLFFAMRSWEYSKSDEENPRTELLTIDDVKFYNKNGNELKSKRHLAHYVKLIFRNQKNGKKMESQYRLRSNTNSKLCPVRIWYSIVKRIEGYKNTSCKTPVNMVIVNGKKTLIRSSAVWQHVKMAVTIIGEDTLKVKASEVGTHSSAYIFRNHAMAKQHRPKRHHDLSWLALERLREVHLLHSYSGFRHRQYLKQ